ncbi:MAG: hypothetical protein J6Y64_05515, partial [Ruminococcus sp.]|nr:hypothetical protein [Ruminococcus sp.]
YREMSAEDKNLRAYALCSDADTVLFDNYGDCVRLFRTVKRVHGSHSTIENVGEHIAELILEIQKDSGKCSETGENE